ncbi:MAG: type I restriction endonuclease subunit S [Selenomonas ruminantium]|nr:type I restriction endonuclease subunit S [Selenomonas ruminantium]
MDKVRIGDICTVVSGSTPKSNIEEYWNGDIKWITPAEIDGDSYVISDTERHITEKAVEKTNLTLLPVGTVLLSSRAPIGKTAIAGAEMYCNQGFKNLICSERIYNKYLYFFLTSKVDYLNALGRGATFKEISKGIVEDVEIPLPTIEVQKNIAKRLEVIQQLINNRKQALLQIDNLVKSRFIEMFGDPVTNPMGWKVTTVGQVTTDVRYGTSAKANDDGQYKYLRMNNLTYDGYLDLSDLKHIDVSDDELEKCVVRKGDVLFNRTNSTELVGKTALFDLDEDMVIAGYIIRVRLHEFVSPVFFTRFMNMEFMKKQLRSMAKGAVNQANINAQELKAIAMYVPPIELQNEFADFVEQADKSKLSIQQSIETLQTLKAKLMQDYFC